MHCWGNLQIAAARRLDISQSPTASQALCFCWKLQAAALLLPGAIPAQGRAAAVSSRSHACGITRPPGGRRRVRLAMPILGTRPSAAACSSGAPTEPISMHQRVDTSQAGENQILNAPWWSGEADRVNASVHYVLTENCAERPSPGSAAGPCRHAPGAGRHPALRRGMCSVGACRFPHPSSPFLCGAGPLTVISKLFRSHQSSARQGHTAQSAAARCADVSPTPGAAFTLQYQKHIGMPASSAYRAHH